MAGVLAPAARRRDRRQAQHGDRRRDARAEVLARLAQTGVVPG